MKRHAKQLTPIQHESRIRAGRGAVTPLVTFKNCLECNAQFVAIPWHKKYCCKEHQQAKYHGRALNGKP